MSGTVYCTLWLKTHPNFLFNIVKLVFAHHPYEASRDDEISFEKDEIIKVTDDTDPDWWVGKKKDGSLGFFPSNVSLQLCN
jgi:hypothetical protein